MYSNYKKWFPLDTFSSGLNVQKQAILNICVNGNKREICNIYTTFHPRVILSGPGQEVEDGHRLTGADSHSAQPRLITPSVQPAPVSEVRADNPQSWHPVSCCQQWKCSEKPILICELNSRVKFHASIQFKFTLVEWNVDHILGFKKSVQLNMHAEQFKS